MLAPRWKLQAVHTEGTNPLAVRQTARCVALSAFGGQLGTVATVALTDALMDALFPPECTVGTAEARLRAASVLVVGAGGTSPDHSRAVGGRILPGPPASTLMAARLNDVQVLLLGLHAASPELHTTCEALSVNAGVRATLLVGEEAGKGGGGEGGSGGGYSGRGGIDGETGGSDGVDSHGVCSQSHGSVAGAIEAAFESRRR